MPCREGRLVFGKRLGVENDEQIDCAASCAFAESLAIISLMYLHMHTLAGLDWPRVDETLFDDQRRVTKQ